MKGTLVCIYLRILLEKSSKDYNCPGIWNSNCMQILFMIFSSALSAATADSAYLVNECVMKTDRLLNGEMGTRTRDPDTKYTFLIKIIEILHLKKNLEFFSSDSIVFLFNHGLYGYIFLASSFSLCNSILKYCELHKEWLKKGSFNCVLTVYLRSALSYETKDVYFFSVSFKFVEG